jgi:hypothetical protein
VPGKLPDEWAVVRAERRSIETIRRCRAAGVDVREDRWLAIFGGQPTGHYALTWSRPRPGVLDPSLFEPHFPRPI